MMATTSSTAPTSPSSHFYAQSHAPLTRSDTIDLTGDDDLYDNARQTKRPRTDLEALEPPISKSPTPSITTPSPTPSNSQISPFSKQTAQVTLRATPTFSIPNIQTQSAYTPHFSGPSNSSAFFPNRSVQSALASSPSVTGTIITKSQSPSQQHQSSRRQIIDLTTSPSPPPPAEQDAQSAQLPQIAHQQGAPLLDVPPKTPVCIGQLTVTALVLYPISYLEHQTSPVVNPSEVDWATVRLHYDAALKQRNPNAEETIHIRTPSIRTLSGEIILGENFGVVEQKVATVLGPMLGRGLIRLDAKVRRGVPNLPILPLQMLVHTPNGNIPIVARFLQQSGLLLDNPTDVWDPVRLRHFLYSNPHNPPPGGHARNIIGLNRTSCSGPAGNKWNMPSVSGKSVEVQRSQVDEVFKSLRSGDELEETEPSPDIATKLYSHQKKALTFLLEREREITGPDGKSSSLWQTKRSNDDRQQVWFNLVTQKEVTSPPRESKGALLADDMGLGKTITCVSLIAATLSKAREFSQLPLPPPPRPPLEHHNSAPSLQASHFASSVWGMPDTSVVNDVMSVKQRAKKEKEQERLEADYARARRIKVRSRATLIICPLSTVVNWEDQLKEHWAGEVQVVGGAGVACSSSSQTNGSQIMTNSSRATEQQSCSDSMVISESDGAPQSSPPSGNRKKGSPLRVYIYHGNTRRPDPHFLADFDAVITTYATLATEFSKQQKSIAVQEADDDDDGNSTEGADVLPETDSYGNQLIQLPMAKKGVKRKKNNALFSGFVEATSPLQSVYWFRIVLDEAHSIKETTTVASRASCDLKADRRLCLTGTPVQNKLDDVYALIKFLRLDPFDDKSTWQEYIGNPVKYGQPLGVARLQTIMKCLTLRRTKETKARNGQAILKLPPRRDELRYLKFDEQEQKIYDEFFTESRAEFNELSHRNEVMKNYVGILQKILRLRQICDHYELVDGKGPSDTGLNYEEIIEAISKEGITPHRAGAIFSLIRDSGTAQCVECGCELGAPADLTQNENKMDLDGVTPATAKRGRKTKNNSRAPTRQSSPTVTRLVMSRCQHLFCIGCFQNSIFARWPSVERDAKRVCTVCQTVLSATDAVELSPDCSMADFLPKKKVAKKEKRQKGVDLENFHPSTKVKALLGDLVNFSRANPYSANYDPASIEVQMVDEKGNELDDNVVKTVVFSQWTTMLDKIEDALEAAGIRYDRLDGTMKRDERTRAMDALKRDPGCEVLLVSLKAGGVGLNLTAAQRVYLMDPYWNPAVENQAVDRIHRLGQNRPVTTVKLIIENTIEARLLEVQRKKTELANMTLGQHLSKAEMLSRRMEELNELFHG